eukprot:scaffold64282_cov69-Cyclotella_meneghiniana.AAC.2
MANKGSDMSRQVTSVIDSDSYVDIHWRRSMIIDLSTAFGRKPGTFSNSQVTLVVKFRRRATELFFKSQDYFIRATLLYALQREMNSLELKSMNLILSFIQATLTKARYRECQHVLKCKETEFSKLEVNAIKIQRLWRLYKYVLSTVEQNCVPESPSSSGDRLKQLCQGCILIQALMRGFLLRTLRDSLSINACIIQRAWAKYISNRKLYVQPPIINYLPIIAIQRMWKEKRLEAGPESETCTSSDGSTQSPPPSPRTARHKSYAKAHQSTLSALTKFQAHFRTRRIQLNVVKIQACARMANQQCRYGKIRNGIIQLQALVRGGWSRVSFYIIYAATMKIQTFARDVLTRRIDTTLASIDEVHYPLTKLQAMFRYYIERSRFIKLKRGCVLLQAMARGKRAQSMYTNTLLGVQLIQATIRGNQQKMVYASIIRQPMTASTVSLPPYLLCTTEDQSNDKFAQSSAPIDDMFAVKIQSFIRGALTKMKYSNWQSSAIVIQATVRRRLAIQSFAKMMSSLIAIQSWTRSAALRKDLLYFSGCAQKIQLAWYNYKATQDVRYLDVLRQKFMLRKAIVVVQKNWRSSKSLRREEAAIKLQCLGRMWIARQLVLSDQNLANRNKAAVKLQSLGRAVIVRSNIDSANQYASKIQRCYYLHCRVIQKTLEDSRIVYTSELRLNYETSAAILLQARLRGCNCRRQAKARSVCAFKIQRLYKEWKRVMVVISHNMANAELARKEEAAKKLQSFARASAVKRNIKSANQYASSIQRCYKKYLQQAMKNSYDLRIAYSEELGLQYEARSMKLQELAATRIQSIFRSWICRKDLISERELVSAIDLVKTNEHLTPKLLTVSEFKQTVRMPDMPRKELVTLSSPVTRLEKEHYKKVSARTIQKVIRGWLCHSRHRLLCHTLIKIQAIGRKYVIRRKLFALNKNAMIIQIFWRTKANTAASVMYQDYCRGINAIQTRCQTSYSIRFHKDLASTLQRIWRGRQVRDDLMFRNFAASTVQRAWAKHRREYTKYRLVQEEYVALTEGMLRLQACLRRTNQKSSNQTLNFHQLASVLQAIWRGVSARRQRNHFDNAAAAIQGCWMSHYKSKFDDQQHGEYQLLITRVVSIQRCFRKVCAKSNAVKVKDAAVKIQSQMRMYQVRTQYLRLIVSTKVLQAVIRTHIAKLFALQMLKEKNSAIRLQSFVRARTVRIELSRQACATSIIQTRYQMFKDMRDYERKKQAVVALQGFARIVAAKNIYRTHAQCCLVVLSLKAVIIQRAWKFRHKSSNQKEAYLRFINALVAFSGSIRKRHNDRHKAAKKIQVLYFSWKMRLSLAYVLYSISQIQTASRHYLARIEKKKRHSAFIIQRFFKNYCTSESEESDYSPSEYSSNDSSMEDESLSDEMSYSSSSQFGRDNNNESSVGIIEVLKVDDDLRTSSALVVQRFFKTIVLNVQSERNMLKVIDAVILLQYKWRCKARAAVSRQEHAAIKILSIYLQWQCQKAVIESTERAHRDAAATLFQKHVRSWRCRQELLSYSSNAIKVQRCFRKYLGKLKEDEVERKVSHDRTVAATVIQSAGRCWMHKKKRVKLNKQLEQKTAAVKIQSFSRIKLAPALLSNRRNASTQHEINSITTCPLQDETCTERKIQVQPLQHLSQHFKDKKVVAVPQQLKSRSAITIQSMTRMFFSLRDFRYAREACVKIQSSFRRYAYQRILQEAIAKAVVLQCWFRTLAGKSVKLTLELKSKAIKKAVSCATILQSLVRGFLTRHRLGTANDAARLIQQAQRASVVRLRHKLLQVFHRQSSFNTSAPSFKRSNSALLPKEPLQLNRVRDIAPNLPRQNGVFVEVILNSVAVVLQSYVRRYIAKRVYHSKIVALKCKQTALKIVDQETNIAVIPGRMPKTQPTQLESSSPDSSIILPSPKQSIPTSTMHSKSPLESMPYVSSGQSGSHVDSVSVSQDQPTQFESISPNSAITLTSPEQLIPTSTMHLESSPTSLPYVSSGQSDNRVDSVDISQDGHDINSHVILIQRIVRGSNVRKSTIVKGSLQHQKQLNTGSVFSSSCRLYTEDENRAFMEQIYQDAEEQIHTGAKSECVLRYAEKLLIAEKKESFD